MWLKWLPWRFVVRQLARSHGFFDPLLLVSRLQNFAQPSEVAVPIEVLRIGAVLQARGLINSQAIQHNLDWIWPYWVEQQFDPLSCSFIPRAFSLTHINLTQRNWTAVGVPGIEEYPIIDPRGLITPLFDAWSIDAWIIPAQGPPLIPAKENNVEQKMRVQGNLAVETNLVNNSAKLFGLAEMAENEDGFFCRSRWRGSGRSGGWLVLSLRPYNPEGISFIHDITVQPGNSSLKINNRDDLYLRQRPDKLMFSNYRQGDVFHRLFLPEKTERKFECSVGMVTAAAMYRLSSGQEREIIVEVPIKKALRKRNMKADPEQAWRESEKNRSVLEVPDSRIRFLYEAALRTVILHSPDEVFPGPYTYRHFWFRDAAFIVNAMLLCGLPGRSLRAIENFFNHQLPSGYFSSQEGEWDSNGQVLWTILRYCRLTGEDPKQHWLGPIERGAAWIVRKRLTEDVDIPHAGLMPAGFSAEHLGPNNYYYWDDFWSAGGLRAAAELMDSGGHGKGEKYLKEADSLLKSCERSLEFAWKDRVSNDKAIPASPYRRMDSGAIGSLAAGYPLRLWAPDDPRLMDTVEYLFRSCLVNNGFFHDMSHSGINPYLTLHIAQVLLRAGDRRCFQLIRAVAELASSTGQWPEAVHPRTLGGCMGDGQHVWAAAEWIAMLRNCFVREEGGKLILFSGILPEWRETGKRISFGPALTDFGDIFLSLVQSEGKIKAECKGDWRGNPPDLEARLPDMRPQVFAPGRSDLEIKAAQ